MSSEVKRVQDGFPDELAKRLDFTETSEYVIAKFKHFQPTETFKQVVDIVKQLGGEYISAGKESHFRFKKALAQKCELCGKQEKDVQYIVGIFQHLCPNCQTLADKTIERYVRYLSTLTLEAFMDECRRVLAKLEEATKQ